MLILRIKQAECALADGRLDEAFELVRAKDVREHRRGQDLAGQVARALVARGRTHLASGQLTLASADCDKAGQLGGHLPEIAELRAAVVAEMMGKQQAEQRQAQTVAVAHRQIEQGQLSLGQRLLGGIQDANGKAAALLEDIAARRVMIDAIVQKAAAALDRDDWEAAVDELARARQNNLTDSRLREVIAKATRLLGERIEGAIQAGRLDMAGALHKRFCRIAEWTVDSERIGRVLEQCRQAWRCIARGQVRQAEQILRRLAAVVPAADWIQSALKNLEVAGEALDQLQSGPLALLEEQGGGEAVTRVPQEPVQPVKPVPVIPIAPVASPAGSLPGKFVIQVDGVGSYLVVRGGRVTLGPISSSPVPDVGFLIEAHTPAIMVERIEEDYFLKTNAGAPVGVGHGRLLANGERIALSPRCRMSFRLPSAASTTALLELHSARLSRADVRHVILLDREIIFSGGPSAHIRADELTEPAVLLVRDGRLVCQTKNEITIDGRPADRSAAIPIGSHIRVGAVTFVVTGA
ncbi:MAG: hypothetical protein ACM359_09855 [Bacillota bacterium]